MASPNQEERKSLFQKMKRTTSMRW